MKFRLNIPVETDEPTVVVSGDLKFGIHSFTLVVVDEFGNRSKPANVDVLVANSGMNTRLNGKDGHLRNRKSD